MAPAKICVKIEEKLWQYLRSSENTSWDNQDQFQLATNAWLYTLAHQGLTDEGSGSWQLDDGCFTLRCSPAGCLKIQCFTLRTVLNWKRLEGEKQNIKRWEELTILLPHNFEECNAPPWTQVEDHIKGLTKQRDGMSRTIDGYMKSLEDAKKQYDELDKHCAHLAKARDIAGEKVVQLHSIVMEHNIAVGYSETEMMAVARHIRKLDGQYRELDKQMAVVRAMVVQNNLPMDSGEHPSRTVAQYLERLKYRLKELGEPIDGLGTYPGEKPSKAEEMQELHKVIDSLRVEVEDFLKKEKGSVRRTNEADAELLTELEQLHRIDDIARKVYNHLALGQDASVHDGQVIVPVSKELWNEFSDALFDATRKGCTHDTDGDGNCPIHVKGCPPELNRHSYTIAGVDWSTDYVARLQRIEKASEKVLEWLKPTASGWSINLELYVQFREAMKCGEQYDYSYNLCETEEGKKWCGAYVRTKDGVMTCVHCGKVVTKLPKMNEGQLRSAYTAWHGRKKV